MKRATRNAKPPAEKKKKGVKRPRLHPEDQAAAVVGQEEEAVALEDLAAAAEVEVEQAAAGELVDC